MSTTIFTTMLKQNLDASQVSNTVRSSAMSSLTSLERKSDPATQLYTREECVSATTPGIDKAVYVTMAISLSINLAVLAYWSGQKCYKRKLRKRDEEEHRQREEEQEEEDYPDAKELDDIWVDESVMFRKTTAAPRRVEFSDPRDGAASAEDRLGERGGRGGPSARPEAARVPPFRKLDDLPGIGAKNKPPERELPTGRTAGLRSEPIEKSKPERASPPSRSIGPSGGAREPPNGKGRESQYEPYSREAESRMKGGAGGRKPEDED